MSLCLSYGAPRVPVEAAAPPAVLLWRCPMCKGAARWESGERCLECHGYGLVEEEPDPEIWTGEGEHQRAPLPPALMPAPCGDCAFRPGAPEEGADGGIPATAPFYCHRGLHSTEAGDYVPTASWRGVPLGALLCRGWWDVCVEKQPPPTRPYRDKDMT